MSKCLNVREVKVAIRMDRQGDSFIFTVFFPHLWSKSDVLAYVREEHPNDSVRIENWGDLGGWGSGLYMANPEGFSDFKHAKKDRPKMRMRGSL